MVCAFGAESSLQTTLLLSLGRYTMIVLFKGTHRWQSSKADQVVLHVRISDLVTDLAVSCDEGVVYHSLAAPKGKALLQTWIEHDRSDQLQQ